MAACEFLFLSQEDVVAAGGLDMDDCLATIAETMALHQRGETIAPPKTAIHWSDEIDTDEKHGRIMIMPAFVGGGTAMAGVKWIPSVPRNPERGLPRGIGMILLTDPETGLPRCFLDGTVVSAMRTGAVSGVAARHLAKPGSRVLAILGAGVQARTQLLALERALPDLAEIRVHDLNKAQTARFVEREGPGRPPIVPYESGREAARGADVLVAATMAPAPFITPDWLEPGMTLISVSSHDPHVSAVAAADLLVTDDLEHELSHPPRPLARADAAGVLDRDAVVNLGAVVTGDHPGRTSPEQTILVSPIGMGIEDVAWGTRVYRRALAAGIGTTLRLWNEPIWTR